MTVYLDIVMVLNFLVDLLLLLGTNRLAGFPAEPGRCALGALLGAVYSGACLMPGFRFLGNGLWRTVSLGLMAVVAFGLDGSTWKRGGIFVILSMALGGIAMSLGSRDFLPLLGCAGALLLLCRIGFGSGVGEKAYVPVTIYQGEEALRVIALRDTGNSLRDPITGEQVLVLSGRMAERLTGLTREQLSSPLETAAQRPVPGLRLIPCSTVSGGGFLLARRFEKVRIGDRVRSALVAFAPEDIGRGEAYQALTGGAL